MIEIGSFRPVGDGFTGYLITLGVTAELALTPITSDHERAPDLRVLHNGREVGAAWRRQAKSGRAFLTLSIQDPAFMCPLRATLFPPREADDELWTLCWDRSGKAD